MKENKTDSKHQKIQIKIIAEKEYKVLDKKPAQNEIDLDGVELWCYVYEDIERMKMIKKDEKKSIHLCEFGKKHEWKDYIIQGPILNRLLNIGNSMTATSADSEDIEASNVNKREYKSIMVSESVKNIFKGLYWKYKDCPLILKENLLKKEKNFNDVDCNDSASINENEEHITLERQAENLILEEFEKSDIYQRYVNFNALTLEYVMKDKNTLYQYEKLYAFCLIDEEIDTLMCGINNVWIKWDNRTKDWLESWNRVEICNKIMTVAYEHLGVNAILTMDYFYRIYHLFGVYNRIINARKVLSSIELVDCDFSKPLKLDSDACKLIERMEKLSDKIGDGRIEQRNQEKDAIEKVNAYYKALWSCVKEDQQRITKNKQRNYARFLFEKKNKISDESVYAILNRIQDMKEELKKIYEKCKQVDKQEYDGIKLFLDKMEQDFLSEFRSGYELYETLIFYYNKINLKNKDCFKLWLYVNKANTLIRTSAVNLKNALEDVIIEFDEICKNKEKISSESVDDPLEWWELNIVDVLYSKICCLNQEFLKNKYKSSYKKSPDEQREEKKKANMFCFYISCVEKDAENELKKILASTIELFEKLIEMLTGSAKEMYEKIYRKDVEKYDTDLAKKRGEELKILIDKLYDDSKECNNQISLNILGKMKHNLEEIIDNKDMYNDEFDQNENVLSRSEEFIKSIDHIEDELYEYIVLMNKAGILDAKKSNFYCDRINEMDNKYSGFEKKISLAANKHCYDDFWDDKKNMENLRELFVEKVKDFFGIPTHDDSEEIFAIFSDINSRIRQMFEEITNELLNSDIIQTPCENCFKEIDVIIDFFKTIRKYFFDGKREAVEVHIHKILKGQEERCLLYDISQVIKEFTKKLVCKTDTVECDAEIKNSWSADFKKLISHDQASEYESILGDLEMEKERYLEALNEVFFVNSKDTVSICIDFQKNNYESGRKGLNKILKKNKVKESDCYSKWYEKIITKYMVKKIWDQYGGEGWIEDENLEEKNSEEKITKLISRAIEHNRFVRGYMQKCITDQIKWRMHNKIGNHIVGHSFFEHDIQVMGQTQGKEFV